MRTTISLFIAAAAAAVLPVAPAVAEPTEPWQPPVLASEPFEHPTLNREPNRSAMSPDMGPRKKVQLSVRQVRKVGDPV
jgi:hypothetical protein